MKIFTANGTIRRARFVKIDTSDNNSVLEANANEQIIGISQLGSRTTPLPAETDDPPNAAIATETLHVHTDNSKREDIVLEIGTGGITAGAKIKSDADGKGVAAATTGTTMQWVGAVALEAASEGELCKVALQIYPHYPALA